VSILNGNVKHNRLGKSFRDYEIIVSETAVSEMTYTVSSGTL